MAYIFQNSDPSQTSSTNATTAVPAKPAFGGNNSAYSTLMVGVPLLVVVAAWVIIRSIRTKDVVVPESATIPATQTPKAQPVKRVVETASPVSQTASRSVAASAPVVKAESTVDTERVAREAAEARARQLAIKERKKQKRLAKQTMQANASLAKSDRLAKPASINTFRATGSGATDATASELAADNSIHVPMVVRTAVAVTEPTYDADLDEEFDDVQPRVATVALTTAINATRMQQQEKSRKKESTARKPAKVATAGFMKFDRVVHERREVASATRSQPTYATKASETGNTYQTQPESSSESNNEAATAEPRTLKDFIRKES
jgi:hypothetical protein